LSRVIVEEFYVGGERRKIADAEVIGIAKLILEFV
jgi:hypothetical protein